MGILVATDASVRPKSSKGKAFQGWSVVIYNPGTAELQVFVHREPYTQGANIVALETRAVQGALGYLGQVPATIYSDSLTTVQGFVGGSSGKITTGTAEHKIEKVKAHKSVTSVPRALNYLADKVLRCSGKEVMFKSRYLPVVKDLVPVSKFTLRLI